MVGTGNIALNNHLPGLKLCDGAELGALCDTSPDVLAAAAARTGVTRTFSDYKEAVAADGVEAVIVATPNAFHREIVLAAVAAGRHVLCEKPLALDLAGAREMLDAAEAAGVRHMTAFTYRFVPAMRYLKHLVGRGDLGRPVHFRAQRFQDWGDRPLGWRQSTALAGSGELGDMLSHRIDYAHHLVGPTTRLVADLGRLHDSRGGRPSDVDDWVSVLADFSTEGGTANGVLESTKLAVGIGEGYGGRDAVELNGTDASAAYSTQEPLTLRIARAGDSAFRQIDVPADFLVYPGSPRDPAAGDPRVTFRYDQDVEFIAAIREDRPCRPSFADGVAAQAVMGAIQTSARERRWVDLT